MEQLELPLWETLRSAHMMPEQVDFAVLLTEVVEAIAQVPESEQLRLAGEAFLRLAEVYAARSETWIEEWEQASRDPVVERSFFDDLVRQTMAVDLSELMEPAPLRKQRTRKESRQEGSIVAVVEKEVVLAIITQIEEANQNEILKQEFLNTTYVEDIDRWVTEISCWLSAQNNLESVQIANLQASLDISWIELWIGLLLGKFEMEQKGEFYSQNIDIKLTPR